MQRYFGFCTILYLILSGTVYADTDIVTIQKSGDRYMTLDTIIESSGSFQDGTIYIQNSLNIINNGVITSALNVCDNCNVYIENTGTYNAPATLGTNATITQVIKNASDITTLHNIGNNTYGVLVQDTTIALNWTTIKDTVVGANKFAFDNAKLEMNNLGIVDNVKITGNLFIDTHDAPSGDKLLFTNVSGDGVVYINSDTLDILYALESYRVANSIYVRPVRSGDYGRILNNSAGRFLNLLRDKSPDDKLLNKLDRAKTMSELKHIMSKSVRLHPIKLMQPIKTLYVHKSLETMHIDDDAMFGFMPYGVFSDDMSWSGVGARFYTKISDILHLTISGHISELEYSDDINEYGGMSYGAGIDIVGHLYSDKFVRVYGDFNFTSFDTGPVLDGNDATNNPIGMSGYVVGEFGYKFDVDEYYVSPFVMAGSDYTEILNDNELGLYAGVGANAGFNIVVDGLRYDYVARGIIRSDGGVGVSLNTSAWSIMDAAGVDFSVGTIYDNEIGLSYSVSINGKFNF